MAPLHPLSECHRVMGDLALVRVLLGEEAFLAAAAWLMQDILVEVLRRSTTERVPA